MAGKDRFTSTEKSWIIYDWANSVYATIMMAAIYPIYFTGFVNGQGVAGDAWWGLGNSVSMAIIAVTAPILGAVADFHGYKKKLFVVFLVIGLLFTLVSATFVFWPLMLMGYILSRVGFNGSCLVYDSFLTDVTTTERMDKVSNYGYAFGYIGGSTIPFVLAIGLMQLAPRLGISTGTAVKISLIITVLWWGLFSIPILKNVRQLHGVPKPKTGAFKGTFAAVALTAKKIFKNKAVFFFILAYFLYIDGVDTIITMSTAYGTTLGLDAVGMIAALLLTQIVAFPCSILFRVLAKRFGSLKMLLFAVCMYLCICILGFIMGIGLEKALFGMGTARALFWTVAILVGTVQGGIQATSRSHFAKIVPPENSGEFFGFFDIFGKFASILGPALYATIRNLTGSPAYAILSITLLFVAALFVFGVGGKYMKNPEKL
jgi:UMF1 family MFS transporter